VAGNQGAAILSGENKLLSDEKDKSRKRRFRKVTILPRGSSAYVQRVQF